MLRRALDALYAVSAGLAALALFAIFCTMVGQSVLRELHIQFPAADDVTSYLCVAATFFALAQTFKRGEIIRVGLVMERLSGRLRHVMELAVLGMAILLMGYVVWWTGQDTLFSWEIEEVAQGTVPIPLWYPKLAMPVGSGIFLIALIDEFVCTLRGMTPSYVRAAQERAANQDYSAEV